MTAMKQCIKCAIRVDDEAKICRRCGSILEEMAWEEILAPDVNVMPGVAVAADRVAPPLDPAALPDPVDQFVAESFQWQCPSCGEQIERQFDACSQCGTNREGSSLPDFTREVDGEDPSPDDDVSPVAATEPAAQAASGPQRRDCLRCGSDKIIAGVNVVAFASGEQAAGRLELMALEDHERLLFMGRQARLTADVCAVCGHVELRAENVAGLPQRRRERW
jgi:hypothetical protein